MADTFTCEQCGLSFVKAWTDKEAEAEALAEYGDLEDMAIICDNCWRKMGFS